MYQNQIHHINTGSEKQSVSENKKWNFTSLSVFGESNVYSPEILT